MTLHEKSPPIPETVFCPLPFPFSFHPLCPCICLFSSRTKTHIYILHFCPSRCESCDPPPLFSHHKERAPPLEKRRQGKVYPYVNSGLRVLVEFVSNFHTSLAFLLLLPRSHLCFSFFYPLAARVSASFFRFVPLSTALSPFSCFSYAFCLIRFSPTHHHLYY